MSNIVGIDLGTTFSGIAHLNAVGKPEIVPNKDSERITASAVYIDGERVLVGAEAINSAVYDGEGGLVRWIKRYMHEPVFPDKVDGREWSPAELSSLILKKMKQDAEVKIGTITEAVITVPAYFDEVRRQATIRAAEMAGLNVLGIVNEPTAAALYYAKEHGIEGKTLVFDLGGGTFDVTITDVDGLDVDILTSRGNDRLGGYDFDMAMLGLMEAHCKQETGSKLVCESGGRVQLEVDAETFKRNL